MPSFDAEVTQSLKSLQSTVVALEAATAKQNKTLRETATAARAAATATKETAKGAEASAIGFAKTAKGMRAASDEAKKLERSVKGVGQAVTMTGGAVGSLGGRIGNMAEISGKLGAAGVAAGGAALVGGIGANAYLKAQARAESNAAASARMGIDARRARGDAAVAGEYTIQQQAIDRANGISADEAARIANGGGAESMQDALAGLRQLKGMEFQKEIEDAAGIIVRTRGGSFSDAIAGLKEGRADEALRRRLAVAPEDLAADSLGVDRGTFSREVEKTWNARETLGARKVEAAKAAGDVARASLSGDANLQAETIARKTRETMDQVGAKLDDQLVELRASREVEGNMLAALRDIARTLGAGDGSYRQRIIEAQANADRARGAAVER